LSQSTRVTNRRTDGQNDDFHDRASVAESRGKNWLYDRFGDSDIVKCYFITV